MPRFPFSSNTMPWTVAQLDSGKIAAFNGKVILSSNAKDWPNHPRKGFRYWYHDAAEAIGFVPSGRALRWSN
jgi:hypothetical protein